MLTKYFSSLLAALALMAGQAVAEPLKVSTFSTILTEVAQKVGGDQVEVAGHIKPGTDPHAFEPAPGDLQRVSKADLILLSAKHMESYVSKLKEATGGKVPLVEVGDRFPSLKLKGHAGHSHGHAHGAKGDKHDDHEADEDPHWWHSVGNIERAAKVVRDELTKLRPDAKATFAANTEKYSTELDELKKWMKSELAKLPRDKRKLVTSHDAFGYFAQENGFTVYAIEGVSPDEKPSSKHVAELIHTVKKQKVKAIFAEDFQNPKVLEQITKETGAVLGGTLYADGLGEAPADTYAGMMRHNVTTIVLALK